MESAPLNYNQAVFYLCPWRSLSTCAMIQAISLRPTVDSFSGFRATRSRMDDLSSGSMNPLFAMGRFFWVLCLSKNNVVFIFSEWVHKKKGHAAKWAFWMTSLSFFRGNFHDVHAQGCPPCRPRRQRPRGIDNRHCCQLRWGHPQRRKELNWYACFLLPNTENLCF